VRRRLLLAALLLAERYLLRANRQLHNEMRALLAMLRAICARLFRRRPERPEAWIRSTLG
tara:strand:- start:205 stop:384 length:180 start_codon:yes stop_codon:yes gene_type:complete